MWNSFFESPTQPVQYVQSEHDTHETRYADPVQLALSTQWEQAWQPTQRRQWDDPVHASHSVQWVERKQATHDVQNMQDRQSSQSVQLNEPGLSAPAASSRRRRAYVASNSSRESGMAEGAGFTTTVLDQAQARMCGRMTMTRDDLGDVAEELGAVVDEGTRLAYRPRYNVAPTDLHVVLSGDRRIVPAKWGLPRPEGGAPLINARAETVPFRSSFREAFVKRRCVVLADGFYEWRREAGRKQPFWIHPHDGGLLLLAGLFETDPADGRPHFVVITTPPNALVGHIHDRMPAVLTRSEADAWLAGPARHVLHPAPEGMLVATPVSSRVNGVRNDDPACLTPVDPDAPDEPDQLSLFR